MSRGRQPGLAEAFEKLKTQHARYAARGKAAPAAPVYLAASEVKLWPVVFQHRTESAASKGHTRNLAAHAKGADLAPILVWWDGRAWACIDGHHRLAAYRAAGRGTDLITVEAFAGTPEEALAEAAARNTQDKLPMRPAEKIGAAWRLVTTAPGLSKAQTVQATQASPRTVANMRAVREKLGGTPDLSELSWYSARRRAAGEGEPEKDTEDRNEKKAKEMATALGKAFGKQLALWPEAFARALHLYDTQLPERLFEELRDYSREGLEEDE